MNNFVKLTDLEKDTVVVLNTTFIQSVAERTNGSYIIMAFKENHTHYRVKETVDEIMKQIEKNSWITTKTK